MIDHVGKCRMQRMNARWRCAADACTTTFFPCCNGSPGTNLKFLGLISLVS
jgi:hypothetical protein